MGFRRVRTERGILQDAREKLGLTQQQVADGAGIMLRQYQRFESGDRNLSSSSFDIGCRVLAVLELDAAAYGRGDYILMSEEDSAPLYQYLSAKTTDEPHPFKDKLCVFIGRLERCSKREAQERLFAVGGVSQNNIAAFVNYVIAGKGAEETKPYAEAKRYANNGLLTILTEQEFFDALDGKFSPPLAVNADTGDTAFAQVIENKRASYIKRLGVQRQANEEDEDNQ